jgi:hypothetical protein
VYQTAAEFVFTKTSNGALCLGEGWAAPEEHATWSLGHASTLTVPLAEGPHTDLMLEFSLTPFTRHPFFKRQRLGISVNGVALGEEMVEAETSIGFRLPAAQFGAATSLDIELSTPDSCRPADVGLGSDGRLLGMALREVMVMRVPPEPAVAPRILPPLPLRDFEGSPRDEAIVRGFTGLTTEELMMQLESLGHNCEFGLVQRRCGAEPNRLLRFVGISYRSLLMGLDFCFEGIDDPALLHCYLDGNLRQEFMVGHARYGLMFHTFQYEGETTADIVLPRQQKDLSYRRRNFEQMLAEGNRLYVFQRQEALTEAQALPLLNMLQSHGPNALLFVTQDQTRPPGTVEMLRKNLFKGSIDQLAPLTEADRFNLTAWVSLCANAYRLWRENGGGA